jgi:hypothetical protein
VSAAAACKEANLLVVPGRFFQVGVRLAMVRNEVFTEK